MFRDTKAYTGRIKPFGAPQTVTTQTMQSLLFYKHLFPHPVDSGTDANTLTLLRHLSRAFRVHFVSVDTGSVTDESRNFVAAIVDRLTLIRPWNTRSAALRALYAANYRTRAVLFGTPIAALYAQTAPIRSTLRKLVDENNFDVAVFAYWNAAQLASEMKPETTIISHLHDAQFLDPLRRSGIEKDRSQRRRLLLQSAQIKQFELASYSKVDRIITQNPEEQKLYSELLTHTDIRVFPVLIDTNFYQPVDGVRSCAVALLGNFRHQPNIDSAQFMVEEIWPKVRLEVPPAVLWIVGRHAETLPRAILNTAGVETIGSVTDLRPVFARAAVFAAPMRTGTGIKIKILEAMAAGLPVVTTPLGAEALSARRGTEIEVHGNAAEFADGIVRLLKDPATARAIGLAGRRYIERSHSSSAVGDYVTQLYEA
jgi:glycosyltransferase involved in cell wall biosynthesis